jgi:competence protein ComEC
MSLIARSHQFLSSHLLPAVTFCFALGIACAAPGREAGWGPGPFLFLPLLAGICALLAHWRGHRKNNRAAVFLLLPLFFSSGLAHGLLAGRTPPDPGHIFHLINEEQEAVLICTLEQLPAFNGRNSTLLVDLHSLRMKDQPDFSAARGLIQLKLKSPWPKTLMPGDLLAVRARLNQPYTFQNPGSFDYPAFLAGKDIRITGWISSPAHIYQLDQGQSLPHQLRYLPERLRTRISSFIEQKADPEINSVYKALLIGEASGISEEILEAFKGSGTMHILSISGAHLSILASFLFFSFYWLLRRSEQLILHYPVKKIAGLLCLPPLAAYSLLAGAGTPIIRSLIMVIVFMAALCADKKTSLLIPLALAALIILVWDPNSLFTASFQLSFMAIASMTMAAPLLAGITPTDEKAETQGIRIKQHLARYLLAALLVSVAVTIGTAPLLLHYFNRISLIGPAANLAVEALICFWSLPLGFLACPLILIAPPLAALLLHLGGYGLILSLKAANFFGALPVSTLWLPTPAPALMILYYASILLALWGFFGARTAAGNPFLRKTAQIAGIGAWGLTLFLFILPPAELFKQRITTSEITFLDVGQGSSTFLQLPSGKRVLIDGGGSESPSFNVGEDIIARFLWQRGIKQLDGIAITHTDADHYNGIPFLLRRFRPQTLWINEFSGHDRAWEKLLAVADSLHIEIRIPQFGEKLVTGGEAEVISLGNPVEPEGAASNDRSLILRFEQDGQNRQTGQQAFSCLFAGDISRKVEAQLVSENFPLPSTLLLSPHHGSSTSNSEAFLKAVNPQTIIVSAGRFRPNHFPTPEVRQRCAALGIKMLTTAEQGAITVTGDKITGDGKKRQP